MRLVALLHLGGEGFLLGRRSTLGVDTQLRATAPPVIGGHDTRLGRPLILRAGPHRLSCGLRVGTSSIVGIETALEEHA